MSTVSNEFWRKTSEITQPNDIDYSSTRDEHYSYDICHAHIKNSRTKNQKKSFACISYLKHYSSIHL